MKDKQVWRPASSEVDQRMSLSSLEPIGNREAWLDTKVSSIGMQINLIKSGALVLFMKENFVLPAIMLKAIVFALMTINDELDELSLRISKKKDALTLLKIEEDLEFIEGMHRAVVVVSIRSDREN